VGEGSTSQQEIASKALHVMERLTKSGSLVTAHPEELVSVKVR